MTRFVCLSRTIGIGLQQRAAPAARFLLRTPELGPAGLRALIRAHDDSAGQVLARPLAALCREHNLGHDAKAWLSAPDTALLDADMVWLTEPDHHFLRFVEADFPPQLDDIDQPPAALFVTGDPALLLHPQIAIVGARSATPQGLADSRDFAAQLAAMGLVVTSGMADGIDGAAHQAALEAGGYTIAVLGTGVDLVYPRKHAALAKRIATGGALVSEFPLGTAARAEHFPRRNRIIAGLSLGTLVIEAGLRSGSLITARLAAEQGREVLVLPGSVHNRMKRGCHRLIRDGGRLVEKPDEVREALAGPARNLASGLAFRLAECGSASTVPPKPSTDPDQTRLLTALGSDPQSIDILAERSDMSASRVSSLLLELELAGHVGRMPGGRFQRLRHSPVDDKA